MRPRAQGSAVKAAGGQPRTAGVRPSHDPSADPVLVGDGLGTDSAHFVELGALRVQLAKKAADVEYLEGALAEALASSQPRPLVSAPKRLGGADDDGDAWMLHQQLTHLQDNATRCAARDGVSCSNRPWCLPQACPYPLCLPVLLPPAVAELHTPPRAA